ncbi:5-formyltetrahydrofolate cyclo-ligase [Sphingomonas sp. ID0503]|uniref:5-formyltetrahydrofolate cyclo-ligase n=1 Tax=Sphingomonas sp. ID0503 TaxID=3399691 RepID=UPI003AFB500E
MIDKPALRRALRAKRRDFVDAMSAQERDAAQAALCDRVMTDITAGPVALYLAGGAEVDVGGAVEPLLERGIDVALPHVIGRDDLMRFLLWRPGEPLFEGTMGLIQPNPNAREVSPAVILTPLLGFDRALNRIGQGAGHYDRAFAAHPAARRIGVAWSVQEVDALPLDPWDVPLHAVVTESEWIEAP